jgi:hypothetical protein
MRHRGARDHGHRAPGREPALDPGPVVGEAVPRHHRVPHHLPRGATGDQRVEEGKRRREDRKEGLESIEMRGGGQGRKGRGKRREEEKGEREKEKKKERERDRDGAALPP